MTSVAIFSDGETVRAKDTRPYRAAWRLKLPNGHVEHGFARDRRIAEANMRPLRKKLPIFTDRAQASNEAAYARSVARDHGFDDIPEYNRFARRTNAEFSEACEVEIVDLD